MSIQTEAMRQTDQRIITAQCHANGKWSGIEFVNHPTPSGCVRWLPTYSHKLEYDDSETAVREFKLYLESLGLLVPKDLEFPIPE